MATQTFTVLPLANRTGTIQSPAVDWPTQVKSAVLRISSTTYTDPATGIDMSLEESRDGGTTWLFLAGVSGSRGGQLDKFGNPAQPGMRVSLDDAELAIPRKIRGKIVVTGTVRFSVLVDILS